MARVEAAIAQNTTRTAPPPTPNGARMDIARTADSVATMLKNGRSADAVRTLDAARANQPVEVQDALDRSVASRISGCYVAPAGSPVTTGQTLLRVDMAGVRPPAQPDAGRMAQLSEQQRHDVYASIVEARGGQAARDALTNNERVIVGLRTETATTANRGKGAYDDSIAVIWRDAQGGRHAETFTSANTEPTAQYDEAYRNDRSIDFRRTDGQDGDRDGRADLGRMSDGTYALRATTHHNPASAGTNFSLRPTADAVTNGAGRIERDTNHDGLFNGQDPSRLSELNDTFKIHSGSRANRDSAGCQTIAPGDFSRFAGAVQGGNQTTWQYVLSPTSR